MANFHRITSTGDYYTNAAVLDEITLVSPQYAVQFNGTSQYLTSTNPSGWLPSSLGDWTIEAWVYLTGYSASYSSNYVGMIASSSVTNNNNASWQFYVSGTASSWTSVSMTFWTTTASSLGFNTTLNLNNWYHIAATKQGSTIRLFVNGTLLGSGSPTTNDGTTVLRIGDLDNASFRYFFPGYISNLRIVKGTALYTSEFTSPTLPLTNITNTTILTCQSATIVDNGTANTGGTGFTISNPASATVAVPTVATTRTYNNGEFQTMLFDEVSLGVPYSVQLDGTTQYITSAGGASYTLTGDFTVEFWMYATTPRRTNAIILCRNAAYTATNNMYLMFPSGSNTIELNKNGIGTIFGASFALNNNQWYHIVFVRSGSGTNNVTCYINGVNAGSVTDTSTWDWSNLSIGSNPSDGGLPVSTLAYAGYLSNLRIVKGTALYNSKFTVPAIPLNNITNTSLLTFQSSTIVDNGTANTGGTGFTLSPVGSPTVSSSVYPTQVATKRAYSNGMLQISGQFDDYTAITQTYSVLFNGTSNYLLASGSQSTGITSGNFTAECWFYLTGLVNSGSGFYATLYSACGTGVPFNAASNFLWFFIGGTALNAPTSISLTPGAGSSGPSIGTGSMTIPLNTWHHVAVSKNGSNIAMWFNGVKQSSTIANVTTGFTSGTSVIGVNTNSSAYAGYFPGYISNFRIVKSSVYDPTGGNIIVPVSPLTAISGTYLLACQSSTLIDNGLGNSGSPFSLSSGGTPSIFSSVVPF